MPSTVENLSGNVDASPADPRRFQIGRGPGDPVRDPSGEEAGIAAQVVERSKAIEPPRWRGRVRMR